MEQHKDVFTSAFLGLLCFGFNLLLAASSTSGRTFLWILPRSPGKIWFIFYSLCPIFIWVKSFRTFAFVCDDFPRNRGWTSRKLNASEQQTFLSYALRCIDVGMRWIKAEDGERKEEKRDRRGEKRDRKEEKRDRNEGREERRIQRGRGGVVNEW